MPVQQIRCPQCSSPVQANVIQFVDVDQNPQLKQLVMAGALNVAQCGNCGWQGQVAAPLVYHESAHDLLISFVPMELNIPYAEQERMMGQMVRQVVENVPQERRRAYLLQPQQMFRWQTFVEKVLETEGITKEMIERQRKQAELLQTLISADKDVVDYLFKERIREIDDDVFVSMVQAALQQAVQAQQTEPLIRLSNLQARVLTQTAAGRKVEKQQTAVARLQKEAKKEGNMTADLLARHVVDNRDDDEIVDMLMQATDGLRYEFFSAFSQHIDAAAQDGDRAKVDRLTEIRTRLLKQYDELRDQSQKMMQEKLGILNRIAAAPDKLRAIQQNAGQIDEAFLLVLTQEIERASESGELDRLMSLREIRKHLDDAMNAANPPEMQLISMLLRAPGRDEMAQVLDGNPQFVNADLVAALETVSAEIPPNAPPELTERLTEIKALVQARLAVG